ncbi:MAG TPA: hypothetical protein VIF62_17990 [Labilithrix sp.]|jgi:hypothetical protein
MRRGIIALSVCAKPTDLDPAAVLDHTTARNPPPEVAADPGRLAKWNDDQAKRRAASRNMYSGYSLFDVSGCSHTELLSCHRMKSSHVFCSSAH